MNPSIDLLVIGAHPDDAEVHVGGLLALAARRGRKAAILDLTTGDLGTRGTPETRRMEAMEAARILGVERVILDLPDARFTEGNAERDRIIEVLRALRPAVLVLPHPEDHHPDHGRVFRLAREAGFYSGLKNYPCPGERWRPEAMAWVGGDEPSHGARSGGGCLRGLGRAHAGLRRLRQPVHPGSHPAGHAHRPSRASAAASKAGPCTGAPSSRPSSPKVSGARNPWLRPCWTCSPR